MKITFLGAAHEVTGSCHYISVGDKKILIDCGMEQGPDIYENQEIPVQAAEINYVFVTHAHIDHSGLLPLLYQKGFRGIVYATKPTYALCKIMLQDSAHIQMVEAKWVSKKAQRLGQTSKEPLYDLEDVEGVMNLFVPCVYNRKIEVSKEIEIRFVEAGHLLGSASIEIWLKEDDITKKIVFSGDIGNQNRPLIKDPEYIKEADYVVMESTYAGKTHEDVKDYSLLLADVVKQTFKKGGNVLIPAFSVGRTQELLYYFRKIKTEHMLPEYPDFEVYLDSPLAIEATNVFFDNVSCCYDKEAMELIQNGINPLTFPGLKMTVTVEESKAINAIHHPIIIISASGMCEAGRIRHHLKHNLWRKESSVIFVGYQVENTLGRMLLNGIKEVKLYGEMVKVSAAIFNLPGISAHADDPQLKKWISAFQSKITRCFVVHGEDEITENFATDLQEHYHINAVAPYSGTSYDLITGECLKLGNRTKLERKAEQKRNNSVYDKLQTNGEILMHIIKNSRGLPNKELAKFSDQLKELAEKWR